MPLVVYRLITDVVDKLNYMATVCRCRVQGGCGRQSDTTRRVSTSWKRRLHGA